MLLATLGRGQGSEQSVWAEGSSVGADCGNGNHRYHFESGAVRMEAGAAAGNIRLMDEAREVSRAFGLKEAV